MDISGFSQENFSVKDWINESFTSCESFAQKEQHASTLITKLQLLIAKMNAGLEEGSQNLLRSLPRIVIEAESLNRDSHILQNKIRSLQNEMDFQSEKTNSSLTQLQTLDSFKEKVIAVQGALKEADNWSLLSGSIKEALDVNNIDLASEKLIALQNSLEFLSHVPDYEERFRLLENFKDKVESLASPLLISSLSSSSSVSLLVKIFNRIGRQSHLLSVYRKIKKAQLLKIWSIRVEEYNHASIFEWSSFFFATIFDFINEQTQWLTSNFELLDPSLLLLEILNDVFSQLEPKFGFCIEVSLKALERRGSETHFFLIKLKNIIYSHIKQLYEIFGNHSRFKDLTKVIFESFRSYVSKYSSSEISFLSSSLLLQESLEINGISETLRSFSQSIQRAFLSLEEACDRILDFSHGTMFPDFVETIVTSVISSLTQRLGDYMRVLEKDSVSKEIWSTINFSLSLNALSGDYMNLLEKFEITLRMKFANASSSKFRCSEKNSNDFLESIPYFFLLDHLGRSSYEDFVCKCNKKGNILLYSSFSILRKMMEELQMKTFRLLFKAISCELKAVGKAELWKSGASLEEPLPEFGFSPQEYITSIGQYLMTLPMHLEPYISKDSPLFKALSQRVFPYSEGSLLDENHSPDIILGCIARATCDEYYRAILEIPELTENSAKQLSVDIGYLNDILGDLGHSLTSPLNSVWIWIKCPLEKLEITTTEPCESKQLLSTIIQMRKTKIKK